MRGKSLGKIGLEFDGKIGLGCGEKVKEREFSKNLRQHIYLEKKNPVNEAIDMEVGEDNLSTKKRSTYRAQNLFYFHING